MNLQTNSPEFRSIIEEVVRHVDRNPKRLWIDQDEVEKLYGIKPRQLFDLRKEGHVKSKKVGSKVLVNVSSIEKFLNE